MQNIDLCLGQYQDGTQHHGGAPHDGGDRSLGRGSTGSEGQAWAGDGYFTTTGFVDLNLGPIIHREWARHDATKFTIFRRP